MAQKLIAENRRARHDYNLLERYEAGIVLTGTEVKSLREGRASLQQAYADVRDMEVWLVGAHISEYAQGNVNNHDPDRDRKLLLHRKEIESLLGKVRERGFTLVPDPDVLQERPREGRAGAREGQGAVRQATRHRQAGRRSADRARPRPPSLMR